MGRRRNAEQLANPAFNMAAISMAVFLNLKDRSTRLAVRKKFVCLEASCQKKNLLFEETGLGHHFRTIHKINKLTSVFHASVLLLILYFVITLSK